MRLTSEKEKVCLQEVEGGGGIINIFLIRFLNLGNQQCNTREKKQTKNQCDISKLASMCQQEQFALFQKRKEIKKEEIPKKTSVTRGNIETNNLQSSALPCCHHSLAALETPQSQEGHLLAALLAAERCFLASDPDG